MAAVALDNSVLLVIDVQKGFVNETSAATVPVIAELLTRWQSAGGTSVLTQFVNADDSPYVRIIGWSALMPGSDGVDFAPEIEPLASTASLTVRKTGYTALTPHVQQFIGLRHITNIWICGLDTESCVLATTFTAFEAGLTPWLITDACASHAGSRAHEAGILVAGRSIGQGQLLTVAEIPMSAVGGIKGSAG